MKFLLQGLTSEQYCNMRAGSHYSGLQKIWVEAKSKEQAYIIACKNFPNLVINEEYIQSEDEIQELEKRILNTKKEKNKRKKKKLN